MDWNEDSESSSSYAYETQVSEVFHGEERGRAIATKLTESRDKISAFARLAVAFAPSGHAPSISDIEKVEVVLVDEHHLEITASICERDGCATIFVPIPFPKDCEVMTTWKNVCWTTYPNWTRKLKILFVTLRK